MPPYVAHGPVSDELLKPIKPTKPTKFTTESETPMDTIWTGAFWKSLVERLVATLAGALLGLVTADGFDLLSVDWQLVLSVVGTAVLVSLLKGLIANGLTKTGPSLVNSEQVVPAESPEAAVAQSRSVELGDPRDANGDGRDDDNGQFIKRV